MKLVKYNPYGLRTFPRHKRDLFFDDFFTKNVWDNRGNDVELNQPRVNIVEENDKFLIELAAPGLTKEDFNVKLDKDQLVISSENKSDVEEKNERYYRREFNYNSFKRSFYLGEKIDKNSISANYNNGILFVTLLKKEEEIDKGSIDIEIQ